MKSRSRVHRYVCCIALIALAPAASSFDAARIDAGALRFVARQADAPPKPVEAGLPDAPEPAAKEPLVARGPLSFVPSYLCVCPPYCKKPEPRPACIPPGRCCDDYCPKPLPWWCRPSACCPDDYCPKPEPRCLPPLPCKGCPHCKR